MRNYLSLSSRPPEVTIGFTETGSLRERDNPYTLKIWVEIGSEKHTVTTQHINDLSTLSQIADGINQYLDRRSVTGMVTIDPRASPTRLLSSEAIMPQILEGLRINTFRNYRILNFPVERR